MYPWKSPGKNSGVGSHFLLQRIFPTKGSNPGLLYCRQVLYHLNYQEAIEITSLTLEFIKCLTETLFPIENFHSWLIWVRPFSKSNFRNGFQMVAIRHKSIVCPILWFENILKIYSCITSFYKIKITFLKCHFLYMWYINVSDILTSTQYF